MFYFYKSLAKFKLCKSELTTLEFYLLTTGVGYSLYMKQIRKYNKLKNRFTEVIKGTLSNKKTNELQKQIITSYYKVIKGKYDHTLIEYEFINKLSNKDLSIDETLELLAGLVNTTSLNNEIYNFFEKNESLPSKVENKALYRQQLDKIENTLNSDMFIGLEKRSGYTFDALNQFAKDSIFISEVATTGSSSFCSFIRGGNKISISKKWLSDEFKEKRAGSLAHEIGHAYYQTFHICNNDVYNDLGEYPSLYKHEAVAILFELVLGGYNSEKMNTGVRLTSDKQNYLKHILLRCEMEIEMFEVSRDGALTGDYIKKLWLDLNKKYLDLIVEPESIKQDIHWFKGIFGYFYSYGLALATVIPIYREILPFIGNSIEEDILIIETEIKKHLLPD